MSFHLEYVHYRRQYVRCGQKACKRCPHGPYWYAYQRAKGKLVKTYIGRELPDAVIIKVRSTWPELAERLMSHADS